MTVLNDLRRYRELRHVLGTSYLVISFLGRLPVAMMILATLTMVSSMHKLVSEGAIACACMALACGAGNPLVGQLTDKFGQRKVVSFLSVINGVGALTLVSLCHLNMPIWLISLTCAFVGFTSVPVSPLARVRWYASTTHMPTVDAALSYESVADEMVYVLGPALVGIIATAFGTEVPMLVVAALTLVFTCGFALHSSAHLVEPKTHHNSQSTNSSPTLLTVLKHIWPLALAIIFTGIYFGSLQASVTESALRNGLAGLAGLMYAAMGISSATLALLSISFPRTYTYGKRILVGGLGMALFTLLNAYLASGSGSSVSWICALLFAAGFFLGPQLVSVYTLTGLLAPKGSTALAMTIIGAGTIIGQAAGSAVAGQLAQNLGPAYGYTLAGTAAVLMALCALPLLKQSK